MQRALRFAAPIRAAAAAAARELFGEERYLAGHLRRDDYEGYCFGEGLAHFGWRRFGVQVTTEMCFPSLPTVAEALHEAAGTHGLSRVFLATNSRDEAEMKELARLVPFTLWRPPQAFRAEWVPHVELLLCARADAFVGTLTSTFSAAVLVQRDLRRRRRNTTAFFGAKGLTFPA